MNGSMYVHMYHQLCQEKWPLDLLNDVIYPLSLSLGRMFVLQADCLTYISRPIPESILTTATEDSTLPWRVGRFNEAMRDLWMSLPQSTHLLWTGEHGQRGYSAQES